MKLYRLEALRGFAAFYVVLHHSLPHSLRILNWEIGYLFRFGQEAVILFFLLSGFVINYSYQTGCDKTFKTYFAKRVARIYIPLIIIMALGYLLECWRVGEFRNPQIRSLILNLFMLQDVKALKPNVIVEPYMGNTPLWSLSYEWWFYVLYFPLVKWMRNSIWRNRLVFGVTLFCACWYVMSPDFVSRLLMYFLIWWAGVELSERYLNNSLNFGNILPVLIALLGVISLLVLNIFVYSRSGAEIRPGVHPVLEFRHFAFSIFSIVCALAWKRVHWIGFNLIFKPFLMLAPISYTLYISHYYFFVNNDWLPRMNSYIVNWIFYFLTACIFCFVVELRIYPRVRSWAFRQLRI